MDMATAIKKIHEFIDRLPADHPERPELVMAILSLNDHRRTLEMAGLLGELDNDEDDD